jgi:tetratricopeptide (TPR) repeat protein
MRTQTLHIFLVLLVAVGAYLNTVTGNFIWDDKILISENDSVKSWTDLKTNLTSDFFHFDKSPQVAGKRGYYRPLVTLTYMVDYAIWKLNPVGYHATNIALHGANSMLLLLLLSLLVPGEGVPLLAALLFAVHPIHTESVSWVSGRTDVLAALFMLLGLYCYARAYPTQAKGDAPRKPAKWAAAAMASLALAMLAKEMAMVLPAILLAYEYFLVSREGRWEVGPVVKRLLPFVVVIVVYVLWRFVLLGVRAPVNPFIAEWGLFTISLTFVKATGLYASRLILPWPLSAYYHVSPVTSPLQVDFLLSLGAIVAVSAYAWTRRASRIWLFALLFFFLTLLPVSNLIPIGAPRDMGFLVAERFLYLPSVGFCMGMAGIIAWLVHRLRPNTLLSPGRLAVYGAPLLIVLVTLTWLRNRDWQDEFRFYQDALVKAPSAAILHYNLGLLYRDREQFDLAEKEMLEVIRIDRSLSEAHNNLANLKYLRGNLRVAILEWREAARLDPANFEAWYNLAIVLDSLGRAEEAVEAYHGFLKSVPPKRDDLIQQAKIRIDVLSGRHTLPPASLRPPGS